MSSIKMLDKNVCELIAAGEVVERPSSVVKELAENSIDAGARSVEIEIKRGGLELIRVSDDGCGIAREDVPTAFLRHATSKISSADDLDGIMTLGFRGEALAAISSVSRVTLVTCTEGGEATEYSIEGGGEARLRETGAPEGTTVFVRDLFYNTPARMKFLKKDVHEGNAVQSVAEMLALSHPEVAFKLIREGKTAFSTQGRGDAFSALFGVLPRSVADNLIPFSEKRGSVAVEGYITAPSASRQSRSMQSAFVNGRYVKSRSIAASAEEACKGFVMAGGHPAFAVYVTLPPDSVDINVHPAKTEVRFKNEREVTSTVYSAVRLALSEYAGDISNRITAWKPDGVEPLGGGPSGDALPETDALNEVSAESGGLLGDAVPETGALNAVGTDGGGDSPGARAVSGASASGGSFLTFEADGERTVRGGVAEVSDGTRRRFLDIEPDYPQKPTRTVRGTLSSAGNNAYSGAEAGGQSADGPRPSASPRESRSGGVAEYAEANGQISIGGCGERGGEKSLRFVSEVFSSFAVFETCDSIVFMDKHAAHERILYDKFVRDGAGKSRQTLLAPIVVPLSAEELTALEDNRETVERVGFVVDRFGEREAAVREIPTYFTGKAVREAVEQMAAKLTALANDVSPDESEWLMHSCACRAAIKAGAKSTESELCDLAEKILFGDGAKNCPHGRPVVIEITKKELEKRFGRIQ